LIILDESDTPSNVKELSQPGACGDPTRIYGARRGPDTRRKIEPWSVEGSRSSGRRNHCFVSWFRAYDTHRMQSGDGGAYGRAVIAVQNRRTKLFHYREGWRGFNYASVGTVANMELLAIALVMVWPFIFLWPYTLGLISIGNDFYYAQFTYKAYLLVALADGHFPLWSPTELAGYPFFSNPFAQAVYPLNLIYLVFYVLRGSFSVWNYTLFTIFGIGVFGLGLYCWLRRLCLPCSAALVATLIACMSLKVTETIRFPNAIHSAAWMPWLLFGLTLAASRKHAIRGAVVLGLATVMMVTAGYPYYVIYAVFLVGPYFVALLFPNARSTLLNVTRHEQTDTVRFVIASGGALLIAATIVTPWLMHVGVLMDQTRDRATADFAMATFYKFDLADTLGSWIFPPASTMEGWYYFGMPATLLIGSYLSCAIIGGDGYARHRAIALAIIPWFALVTYFTWGNDSALFQFIWHQLPVLDRMRAGPRMNIILVPAIACLLAFALAYYTELMRRVNDDRNAGRRFIVACSVLVAIAAAAQVYFIYTGTFHDYWQRYFGCPYCSWLDHEGFSYLLSNRFDERLFIAFSVLAAVSLMTPWVLIPRRTSLGKAPIVAVLTVFVSGIDLFYISNFQWPSPFIGQRVESGTTLADLVERPFGKRRELSIHLVQPMARINSVGLVDGWGFIRHGVFFLRFFDETGAPQPFVSEEQTAAAKRFFGVGAQAERLFLSSRIDHQTPLALMADADQRTATDRVEMVFFDGDTLKLRVSVSEPGWLSYIDNWDANWKAQVDGQEVPIELLFGSYKSVHVRPEATMVTFTYSPSLWPTSLQGSGK
jgi:hypothetical protein